MIFINQNVLLSEEKNQFSVENVSYLKGRVHL